jgi:hypothetical protein
MPNDPNTLDPQWAWSAYEPDAKRPWSPKLAAHLYRRAGFGARFDEIDAAVKLGAAAMLDRLCQAPPPSDDFESTSNMLAESAIFDGSAPHLAAWWFYRMLNTSDPLAEKLTLFWHGHFATSLAKVQSPQLMIDQNRLLRTHARGKFEVLAKAISRDPAMLIYLDSTSNRRIHPNENYARELMELFALGVGNYTEADIKEVARAFTGWELLGHHFHFDTVQHDTGSKSFLGSSGNFDGDDAVRIILHQPAALRFIARKLVRFFVFDEPIVSDVLIEPLATQLAESEFSVGPLVRRILSSNLFFSDCALGRKIRSPVELAVGLLRNLGATTSLVDLAQGTGRAGQTLFQPPNVKGWDGGRTWINSSTLLGRANLVGKTLSAPETRFGRMGKSLAEAATRAGATRPQELVHWLLDVLLAVPVPEDACNALIELAQSESSADKVKTIVKIVTAMAALPEFQLC